MDGSGSIRDCNFDKAKQALKNMLDLGMEAGYDNKYAAVSFGSSAMTNFNFTANPDAGKLIKQIPYLRGSTNTQAGLKEAKRLFEDPASGMQIFWLNSFLQGVTWSLLYILKSIIECYHENVTDESDSKMKKNVLQQYQGQE